MRLAKPVVELPDRLNPSWLLQLAKATEGNEPVSLEAMDPPVPIPRIHPDQIIEDIMVATLTRLQDSASPAVAAAAARYITLLRQKAV